MCPITVYCDSPYSHRADFSLVFPPEPGWVRTAREAVRAAVRSADLGGDLADIAALLTSEVVTNSINACAGAGCSAPVALLAQWLVPGRLHVLVRDGAPGLPAQRTGGVEADAEGGRGLHLVGACATDWGVCRHGVGAGKAVWFQLEGAAARE